MSEQRRFVSLSQTAKGDKQVRVSLVEQDTGLSVRYAAKALGIRGVKPAVREALGGAEAGLEELRSALQEIDAEEE